MKTIEEAAKEHAERYAPTLFKELASVYFTSGAQFVQRWIPIEEELPETNCDVIVKKKNGLITFMSFHAPFDSGKRQFNWWCFGNWVNQNNQVTHWRPIERK